VKVPAGSDNAAQVRSSCVVTRATGAMTRFGDGPKKGHGEKLKHDERRIKRFWVRIFGDGAETRTAYVDLYGTPCVFWFRKAREANSRGECERRGLLHVQRGPG
jgi:hypothetical protein